MHKNFPDLDGLIGLNDGLWKRGELYTHWLASKRLLPYLGGEFFHTGYAHCGCDSELMERCKQIGKAAWAELSKIVHDHPSAHGWSDETYDKHYRRVYESDLMRKDRELLFKRSKELGFKVSFGTGCLGDYPDVPAFMDLRKRMLPLGMTVLNVGVGPGDSWLAKQLPHLEFARLDHIDIHEPYIAKAREIPCAAKDVRFKVGDVTKLEDFGEYDMTFMFDLIEHLPKEQGLGLLKMPFKKLLFVPIETKPRENDTGVASQDHVSFWTEREFKDLGYKTEVIKNFVYHRDGAVMDAVWVWN
jgi:2-polyprenyl-3-methyl-5-hydroxy-6-metoxy-1,4-benzoquinol methylase